MCRKFLKDKLSNYEHEKENYSIHILQRPISLLLFIIKQTQYCLHVVFLFLSSEPNCINNKKNFVTLIFLIFEKSLEDVAIFLASGFLRRIRIKLDPKHFNPPNSLDPQEEYIFGSNPILEITVRNFLRAFFVDVEKENRFRN